MPYLLAILAGIFTTLEATVNAKLGRFITPKLATLHSLLVGVLIMLIINIFYGTLNQYTKLSHISIQWLIGGVFGALAIYLLTLLIPILGITITFTIVITSQVLSSFFIETFALKQQLELTQIVGAALIITGLYFVMD
jgi:transporter family-2 protein